MNRKRIVALVLALLALCFEGCSRTFWREDSSTSMRTDLDAHATYQGLNTRSAERQIGILNQRATSHGNDPSERETVSALDSLNLELAAAPIENSALSKGLREVAANLLDDPSEEIRFRAVELLGKVATEEEESALLRVSETDPRAAVREMALEAMELRGLGEEVWKE